MKASSLTSGEFLPFFRNGSFSYYVSLLLMVIMPLNYRYVPPLMILLMIGFLIESSLNKNVIRRSIPELRILFLLFAGFYLWQIITMIYTEDSELGWSNIFGRLSFFIFPLVFLNPGNKTRINRQSLLRTFSLSTTLFIIGCFIYAFYRSLSFSDGSLTFNPVPPAYYWSNYFFEFDFTKTIHPSYLGMYVLISALISFETFYDARIGMKMRASWFMNGVFQIGSLYFISSRAAILAALVVMLIYGVVKIFRVKRFRYLWILFISLLIVMIPLLRTNDKVNNLVSVVIKDKFSIQDERVTAWKSSMNLISQNFILGMGIGDVRNELTREYLRIGEEEIANEKLNAHNQFLEVLLEGGIVQFILFMSIFGYMIFLSVRRKNLLYALFIIMIAIFFMFETVLYRFAGIVFFPLFSFILVKYPEEEMV